MTSSSDPTDNKIKVRLRFKEYVEGDPRRDDLHA